VKRYRRLRRLQPDAELVRRRAAGETFRKLAPAYGVSHSTLSRYFARPQLAQALRAEQRLERELRRQVREQAAAEREHVRRADLHSLNDLTAARTVDAGGGMQAVIEATGLRTRENVLSSIDPTILEQAFRNDAAAKTSRGARRRRPC
jgi:hypothetical protein